MKRFTLMLVVLLVVVVAVRALMAAGAGSAAPPYQPSAVLFPADGRELDLFGAAIAATSDRVVVGAPGRPNRSDAGDGQYGDGAVYLFRREPGGWSEAALIRPPTDLAESWFGQALALDGDTLAVSAPLADRVEDADSGVMTEWTGAVYVYSDEPFDQPPVKLAPADLAQDGRFGAALDLDGDTLIASTQSNTGLGNAAYIFVRHGRTWSQQAKLPQPVVNYVNFGAAVAVQGDVALVSALGTINDLPPIDRGIVYVYTRSGGVWSAAGTLSPDDAERGDAFGCALDFDGRTAVIAACANVPPPPLSLTSRAYVFTRDGDTWTQRARLDPMAGPAGVLNSVALDGDRILIGAADLYDPTLQPRGGQAFLFERDGATWTQTQALRPASVEAGHGFVSAVALAGPDALAGAHRKPWLNAPTHGVVFAFSPRPALAGLAWLPVAARPALEQTTGLIAYVAGQGDSDIYLITPDGRGRTNLTHSPPSEFDPAWSPDGRRLAFIREGASSPELVLLDVGRGAEIVIPTPGADNINGPAWSPDGRFIAYWGLRGANADIFVVGADGGNPTNVTQTARHDESYPAWSPDGTRLAFVDDNTLATMEPDGGDIVPISGALDGASSPDWSPDGTTILYTRRIDGPGDLYTVPAGGGASHLLLENGREARWSPDGAQIIFTGAGWGIFRINADGRGLAVVDPSRVAHMPDWQSE